MPPETTNTTPSNSQQSNGVATGPTLNQPPAPAPTTLAPENGRPLTPHEKADLAVDPAAKTPPTGEAPVTSALEKANAAIQKAKEGARKFAEQKAARERAEKVAEAERQRAYMASQQAQKLLEERQRQEREHMLRSQRAQSEKALQDSPLEWLKAQSEELFNEKQRVNEVFHEVKTLKEQLAKEQRTAAQRAAKEEFVKQSSDKELYPNLQKLPSSFILAMGIQLAQAEAQKGNKLSNDEILQQLEEEYAGHQQASSAPVKAPEKKKSAETNQAAATPKKADTPRTISSEMGRSYALPADFDRMSDIQQKKELGKMLAALSKK